MKRLVLVLLGTLLVACGGNDYRAPIEDRRARYGPPPAVYVVKRGDTLFSIAWRYGLDYRQLARANGIDNNYTIYPGQRLFLKRRAPVAKASKPVANPSATKVNKPSGKSKSQAKTKSAVSYKSVSDWRWPTAGKVIRKFSGTVHKGIDIGGKRGDAVRAVAAGRVVYAGTGITGYGELLIIKHNELYLSAYGHNDKLLVKEGAQVKSGQLIARKGSTGTNTVRLHFEIRREGKPVNPLGLLPTR